MSSEKNRRISVETCPPKERTARTRSPMDRNSTNKKEGVPDVSQSGLFDRKASEKGSLGWGVDRIFAGSGTTDRASGSSCTMERISGSSGTIDRVSSSSGTIDRVSGSSGTIDRISAGTLGSGTIASMTISESDETDWFQLPTPCSQLETPTDEDYSTHDMNYDVAADDPVQRGQSASMRRRDQMRNGRYGTYLWGEKLSTRTSHTQTKENL